MSNALQTQRTYALVGTGGCGKTTLAEMLLFQAGVVSRLGAVEDGTAALDYEPEEIRRRGSIQPGFAAFQWNKAQHYLVDIPGDSNFNGDIDYLLQAVDGVVFTIDAVDGVRPQTRKLWQHVKKAGLPAVAFVTKMDRERADFDAALNGLSSQLGMKTVVFYMPIMDGENFVGLVDIFARKGLMFGENGAVTET
ncbi:MAG: GTP-binding protein, partial [Mailhella sp.]|nr:GTP-binding protein [Mailhella sp.]